MVFVGIGDLDHVTVVMRHFDIVTRLVACRFEGDPVGDRDIVGLVGGIGTAQDQVTAVAHRTRIGIENTCSFGTRGCLVGYIVADRIGDQVTVGSRLGSQDLHREIGGAGTSVAHTHRFDGELRFRRIVLHIETGDHTGQLEAQLRTGGDGEIGQVERRGVGAGHRQRGFQDIGRLVGFQDCGMERLEGCLGRHTGSDNVIRLAGFRLYQWLEAGELCTGSIDQFGAVGNTVDFDEETFLHFQQGGRVVGSRIQGEAGGVFAVDNLAGVFTVIKLLQEGVVASLRLGTENVDVETVDMVFLHRGDHIAGFRSDRADFQLVFKG